MRELTQILPKNCQCPRLASCRNQTAQRMKTGKCYFWRETIAPHFGENVQASLYPFLSNCDRHVWGEVSCNSSFLFYSVPFLVPSMLWCCWLGIRKSIGPVKIEWWGFGMVISLEWGADCLHMVQLMPLYPQTPSCLASCKSRLVLPFWYWLTQVILEKRPLNGCSSSNSSSSANQGITLKSVVTVVFSVDLNFLGIDTHCHSTSIVFSFVQL